MGDKRRMYAKSRVNSNRRARAIAVPIESREARARRERLLMTGLVSGLLLVLVLISSYSGVGP
jgi:hypothetical protein